MYRKIFHLFFCTKRIINFEIEKLLHEEINEYHNVNHQNQIQFCFYFPVKQKSHLTRTKSVCESNETVKRRKKQEKRRVRTKAVKFLFLILSFQKKKVSLHIPFFRLQHQSLYSTILAHYTTNQNTQFLLFNFYVKFL